MVFVVSVIISLVMALPLVSYVSGVAKDAVLKFNLRQISKLADIELIEEGKYPRTIKELVDGKDVGNFDSGVTYRYQVSADGQKAKILGAFSDRSFCWSSENEAIFEVKISIECKN